MNKKDEIVMKSVDYFWKSRRWIKKMPQIQKRALYSMLTQIAFLNYNKSEEETIKKIREDIVNYCNNELGGEVSEVKWASEFFNHYLKRKTEA